MSNESDVPVLREQLQCYFAASAGCDDSLAVRHYRARKFPSVVSGEAQSRRAKKRSHAFSLSFFLSFGCNFSRLSRLDNA